MTTQPEALRLAEILEGGSRQFNAEAAAELRRLHQHEVALSEWLDKTSWLQETARPGELGMHRADAMRARMLKAEAQRDALLEALKKAEENGCSTVYANEYDECGAKGCCGVVSYKPHADDCWVTTARAAIKAVEENT